MIKEFTFENFIKKDNNQFALNVAIAISKNLGKVYNPLLIHSNSGLGKSHLLQAIKNYIQKYRNENVIYITSENFLNEYINSIKEGKMLVFKKKYRSIDALLIDDIQFFMEKSGIQDELFHTINALLDSKKQLVFTCDRPISELKDVSEHLLSRFMQGLIVEIESNK